MPDASAQAFDEARELFLSQMKIVSYYLHVRPIVKKVSNDEIVRFGYGKGSSDSLHFGDLRRRIFATGPLSSLLRLVTKWSKRKENWARRFGDHHRATIGGNYPTTVCRKHTNSGLTVRAQLAERFGMIDSLDFST